jgi:hypothetical protein
VSRTKPVGLGSHEMWVYDVAMSVVLAQVVSLVEEMPSARRPGWWSGVARELRVQAVVSDC